VYNKGTGFTASERERLGVRGLVPPRYFSIEQQAEKIWEQQVLMREDQVPKITRWRHLQALKDRNETLFYRLLIEHVEELAPVIYTPTVGEACLNYSKFFKRARGMFFTKDDVGNFHSMTYNWRGDVKVVVVTDGSRVLGLGDLGAHGMGISIGKLDLYVAGGGFDPSEVLPVTLDVGTNNEQLLNDRWYLGLNSQRLEGGKYYKVIDEFMRAIRHRWPNALIQFEDFQTKHALEILNNYRNDYLCFNDDIQGTAAVVLAGVYGALKALGQERVDIKNHKFVMTGAGSAGMGIVTMLHKAIVKSGGLTEEEAYDNFYILDHNGLITNERELDFPREAAVEPFAKARKATKGLPDGSKLIDVVKKSKCTILMGASTVKGLFTKDVLEQMGNQNERPIIFPLSNPTSNAECTSEEAANATDGRAIFSSGSPFEDAKGPKSGRLMRANQGNNLYIFPGLGLGAVMSGAKTISDEMLVGSAKAIADMLTDDQIRRGCIFPLIKEIRNISAKVAVRVIKQAAEEGQAKKSIIELIENDDENDTNLLRHVKRAQYRPEYRPLVFPISSFSPNVGRDD
jgi:malic enzyme